tara:strand:+ start:1632 stop:2363 length:732 start_codon:yes stop_codon:yes gene_type:complete
MLRFLQRLNSNNNGIYLSMEYGVDKSPYAIKKSSTLPSSISRLKREVDGAKWYSLATNNEYVLSDTNLPNYYSARFTFFPGKKANYKDGYWSNREIIRRAIIEYCGIWSLLPQKKMVIHGDYSIDNLIFDDENIFIIDWEHFSRAKIPIGFDALNLIFEQIFFEDPKKRQDYRTIDHIRDLLKTMINSKCLDQIYFAKPLFNIRSVIANNKNIWGEQIKKLPVMKFSNSEVSYIDELICLKKT